MSDGFELRRMDTRDLPDVLRIERLSFPNPWRQAVFEGELQNPGISFPLVAVRETDGKVVGYIIYWKVRDDVQVNNIAVDPDFRRRGIADALLATVLAAVRAQGAAFVSLEVRASNAPALTLYEKFGFQALGMRKGYYSNPEEDAIVMGMNL